MAKIRRKRRRIPEPIQRELWARAAGRCEFRGCNKLLYFDGTTKKRSNLGKVSHIVAWSPDGPRGDPVRSAELAIDIDNLILTCQEHGKVIDDNDKVGTYTVEVLSTYKREHEQRVRTMTGIDAESQTHVLIVQAAIDGQRINISEKAVYRALTDMYPANEHAYRVDLTALALPETDPQSWAPLAKTLGAEVERQLRVGSRGAHPKHLSVFAMAPIPLLVYLGWILGDENAVDLYQKHRGGQGWNWVDEPSPPNALYEQRGLRECPGAGDVAFAVSVTGDVEQRAIDAVVGSDCAVYEIRASSPGPDFLISRDRLEYFGYEYRKLMARIRQHHGASCHVHLFAAAPAPVAVLCGQSLLRKADPPVTVYEYNKGSGFSKAITVNQAG